MITKPSKEAVEHYLTVAKAIYGSFEVSYITHPDQDKINELRVTYLEDEFGLPKLMGVMKLIGIWLHGSKFKANALHFSKEPDAKWPEMMEIIHENILKYQNETPIIVLTLSPSGRMTREIGSARFEHDFEEDGNKLKIIHTLIEHEGYVATKTIQHMIKSKSTASVEKTVAGINTAIRKSLSLPKERSLIDSKRRSGYRIDPIYNIVLLK